ncbi:MAG: 2-hydroxyacid dehydrogenase, partial [Catalinimonas sp.]
MHITFYSAKRYDERSFQKSNEAFGHTLHFWEVPLNHHTAGFVRPPEAGDDPVAACLFVNDRADAEVVAKLAAGGVQLLALR